MIFVNKQENEMSVWKIETSIILARQHSFASINIDYRQCLNTN